MTQAYPSDVIARFIKNCAAGRGAQVENICACTIRKIQSQYTLEEFQQINEGIKPMPPEMTEMLNSCKKAYDS